MILKAICVGKILFQIIYRRCTLLWFRMKTRSVYYWSMAHTQLLLIFDRLVSMLSVSLLLHRLSSSHNNRILRASSFISCKLNFSSHNSVFATSQTFWTILSSRNSLSPMCFCHTAIFLVWILISIAFSISGCSWGSSSRCLHSSSYR